MPHRAGSRQRNLLARYFASPCDPVQAAASWRGNGEGKRTPLELFSSGVLELEPEIWELIREAA